MANTKKTFYFKGKVAWLLRKANKFGNYTFNFYPADGSVRKEMSSTGFRNKLKEDDGKKSGVEGFFYTLKFPKEPVLFHNSEAFEGYVGNNSDVTVKLIVETFSTKDYGEVTRASVDSVVLDNLVEFVPAAKEEKEEVSEKGEDTPF